MESAFELEFAFNFIILRNAMGERGINYTISNVMQAFGQVSPDPDDDKCLDIFLYLPVSVCPRPLPDLGGGGGRSKVITSSSRLLGGLVPPLYVPVWITEILAVKIMG